MPRDRVVIATKTLIHRGSEPIPPARVVASLERSLRQLDTDYVDVFQLHVVPPAMYDHALHTIAPVLLREKEKGKFRPLGFLIHEGDASSVTDAAYRFVRHEPGVHVMLFGTSSLEHLQANIHSLLKPPLPEADRQQLAELFGHLLGVGLELPEQVMA